MNYESFMAKIEKLLCTETEITFQYKKKQVHRDATNCIKKLRENILIRYAKRN